MSVPEIVSIPFAMSWMAGLMFAVGGLLQLANGRLVGMIAGIIGASLLIPPLKTLMAERWNLKLHWLMKTIIVVIALIMVLPPLPDKTTSSSVTSLNTQAAMPVVIESTPDTLTIIQTVFRGNHSKQEIESKLNVLLKIYGREVNDDNKMKAANALVALRKDAKANISEMEILDQALRLGEAKKSDGSQAMSLPEALALAVTMIELDIK